MCVCGNTLDFRCDELPYIHTTPNFPIVIPFDEYISLLYCFYLNQQFVIGLQVIVMFCDWYEPIATC